MSNSVICSCKANDATFNETTGVCLCNDGFYYENATSCQSCSHVTVTGDSANEECICKATDATFDQETGICTCNAGFYFKTDVICDSCSDVTLTGDATDEICDCIATNATFDVESGACICDLNTAIFNESIYTCACPTNMYLKDGECKSKANRAAAISIPIIVVVVIAAGVVAFFLYKKGILKIGGEDNN